MQFLKPVLFLVFCAICFIFLSCTSGESLLTKKYAPAQLKQDAEVFNNVSLAMHPAIGVYESRSYYANLFNHFTNQLNDSLTEKQFRLKLKLVVDELHCGHTEVMASKQTYRELNNQKLNYSPYLFLPVHDKLYMVANLGKKQDSAFKKGMEVVTINGIACDSMIRYCKRFISGDGRNETAKEHYIQLAFNSYFLSLFGRPDTFDIDYRNGQMIKHIKYPAIKLKALPPLPLGKSNDSLLVKFKRAKIKYRYLDNDKNTLVMKIERFSHKGYNKAYRRIFKHLKENDSQNLVIDLRNNGGGSLANSYKLLTYLVEKPEPQTLRTAIKNYPYRKYTRGNIAFKFTRAIYKLVGKKITVNDTDNFVYTIKPRRKNHFKGKVFVLINGGSFSASSLVAAYLKNNNRAAFIGQETGGAIEGCNAGVTPYYKLPNTHLKIRVPAFRIVHDVSPKITAHGILPDHPVEYTVKDILSRRDLELLKLKELLKIE